MTIAQRTRTKWSLAEKEISELENELAADLDIDTLDNVDYHEFLNSLITCENLPDDEDDEFEVNPLEIEVDEEDDVGKGSLVSKKEYMGLLLDNAVDPSVKVIRGHDHSISMEQRMQLVSQFQKHVQLLAQSFALCVLNEKKNSSSSHRNVVRNAENKRKLETMITCVREKSFRELEEKQKAYAQEGRSESQRLTRSSRNNQDVINRISVFEYTMSNEVDAIISDFEAILDLNSTEGEHERKRNIEDYFTYGGQQRFYLDRHLMPIGKRIASNLDSGAFTQAENDVLCDGAFLNFGDDRFLKIKNDFLMHKTEQQIARHVAYMQSNKASSNPLQERFLKKKSLVAWTKAEDQMLVKGALKFFGEQFMFNKIKKEFVNHRTRSAVRYRWNHIKCDYLLSETTLNIQAATKFIHEKSASEQQPVTPRVEQSKRVNAVGAKVPCSPKNLHPSLFYSVWVNVDANALYANTCEHSQPKAAISNRFESEMLAITQNHSSVEANPWIPEPLFQENTPSDSSITPIVLDNSLSSDASSDSDFEEDELLLSNSEDEIDHHYSECSDIAESDRSSLFEEDEYIDSDDTGDPGPFHFQTPPRQIKSNIAGKIPSPESISSCSKSNNNAWTKNSDRELLLAAKQHGPTLSTWYVTNLTIYHF